MTRSLLILLLLMVAGVFLAVQFAPPAGAPPASYNPLPEWSISDVRLLDPVDTATPTLDLLAVYLRGNGADLDLRLDFLDSATLPDYDLLLALDLYPGGERQLPGGMQSDLKWDALLEIPAGGPLHLLDTEMQAIHGAGMRVLRDPTLDQLTIHLTGLPGPKSRARAQAFILPAGSAKLADWSDPTANHSTSLRPARLGLVFSNTFPAYSPVTALRRWHGAHSGPLGESHGLGLLLAAARDFNTPLAVKDLDRPEALAALDAAGGMGVVAEMAQQGQLALLADPSLPFQPDREAAARFGVHPASIQTKPNDPLKEKRYDDPLQVELDGPSLALRREIIATALEENYANSAKFEPQALILGGELPNSAWGTPIRARAALRYLNSRPWVRFLSVAELLKTLPPIASKPDARFSPTLTSAEQAELLAALQAAPRNALSLAAQQAYAGLFAPVYPLPESLPAQRRTAIGVVWSLIYAAAWAESPQARLDCNVDPDRDGQGECILADERRYAQFESESGQLTFLFSLDEAGAHQWVAPSAQIISGASDLNNWNPAVLPGAFFEPDRNRPPAFEAAISDGQLAFKSVDFSLTYSLAPSSLHVEYRTGQRPPKRIGLALAPDPWQRFQSGWMQRYTWEPFGDGRGVAIHSPAAALRVQSNCRLAPAGFVDSARWMNRPENPDRDYPAGHYLPFPMFLIECRPETQTAIIFEIGE